MLTRRFAMAAAAVALIAPAAAQAHHGIIFTADEQIRITGIVVKEMTGNPHFQLEVQEGDTRWSVDVDNSYRLQKAGLRTNGSDMPLGQRVTIEGFPALDESLKILDARTIWIDGEEHRLFDEDEPKY